MKTEREIRERREELFKLAAESDPQTRRGARILGSFLALDWVLSDSKEETEV